METIRIYEPHEGRWLDVPKQFVHDSDEDLGEGEEKSVESTEDG